MWNKHSCFLWEGFCKLKLSWIVSLFHNEVLLHEGNFGKITCLSAWLLIDAGKLGPWTQFPTQLTAQYSHPLLFLCCIIFKWMLFHIGTIARPELVILISFYAKPCKFFWRHGIHISTDRFRFLSDNLQRESASITSHANRFEEFTLHRCLQGRNL